MKVCFSSFTCPEWNLSQMLHAASGFGYHGLEIRCDAGHQHGVEIQTSPEERQVIAEQFRNQNIEPCCLATGVQIAHQDAEEILTGRLELASDVGFKAVRILCGRQESDYSLADTLEAAATRLRMVVEYARKLNVLIWIETHDVVSLVSDAASLIRQVESDNVGLVYNNLHPFRMGESVEETFEAMGSLMRHVHFHDGLNDRSKVVITPMGEGQLPIETMFKAIVQSGYDGYICGEWFHEQYGHTSDESLMRYRKEITSLASRHGVSFEHNV